MDDLVVESEGDHVDGHPDGVREAQGSVPPWDFTTTPFRPSIMAPLYRLGSTRWRTLRRVDQARM